MHTLTFLGLFYGSIALAMSHPRTRIHVSGPGRAEVTGTHMEIVHARNPLNPFGIVERHAFRIGTPVEEQVRRTLEAEFMVKPIWWAWLYGHPSRALSPFWSPE